MDLVEKPISCCRDRIEGDNVKNDTERRVMINSIGPTWESNQVWFITAGGALFAAWPLVYAAAFSGFYFALIIVLFALILRPVGFDFRSKVADPRWRKLWDWGLFIGGAVPALVFGVALGNLLLGVPFHFDENLRVIYTGSSIALFKPFALLAGVASLALLIMHGATFTALRTEPPIKARACGAAILAAKVFAIVFALGGLWVTFGIEGYRITNMPDPDSAFPPTAKSCEALTGGWLTNYVDYPLTILAPVAGFAGAWLVIRFSRRGQTGLAFAGSALAVVGAVLTPGLAMFPFIMPSSTHPDLSLTLWDSVSSHRTLSIMFWVVILGLPIVIAYTSWVYRVMRGKVTEAHIQKNQHSTY